MSRFTTDPNDPDIKRGLPDEVPVPMNDKYLVLSDDELAKSYVRPYRTTYRHIECGTDTSMGEKLAATYARDPWFYGATYCVNCAKHRPLSDFVWREDGQDTETMDPHQWPDEITRAVVAARAPVEDKPEKEMINERQLPQYKCHKIVGALHIKKVESLPIFQGGGAIITPEEDGYEPFAVSELFLAKHKPAAGDYYVVYSADAKDEYESISPAEAFEKGYTRI